MQNEVTFQAAGVVEVDSPRRRRTQLGGGVHREAAAWTRSGPNAPQIGFTSSGASLLVPAAWGGDELAAPLHRTETVAQLRRQLLDLIARLIADAAASGSVRDDVPPRELASFTIHALDAAGDLTSQTAQTRLVDHLVWMALAVPSERHPGG